MSKYDVIVIGGGPGGYVAAIRSAQLGFKTAVVERDNLGGTCLNWGCIPTKALVRNAEIISYLSEGKTFGFSFDESTLTTDYAAAQKRSRQVSAQLVRGIQFLMKKNKVDVIKGSASFLTSKKIDVEGATYEADNYILATGARPNLIPGVDPADAKIMTSRQALELTELPERIVVVGAGAIGMEFAGIWNAYGCDVTVVEMAPRVLPLEDADTSEEIAKAMLAKGIKIKVGTKLEKIESTDKLTLTLNCDGKTEVLECGKMMLSAGVRPNTENIGLDKIGVKMGPRGHILVDDCMRTNIPGIYAIGDITGKLALAHVASAQGIIAAEVIKGIKNTKVLNYTNLPRCTYTTPEVASIGLTEAQAKEKGIDVKIGKFPFSANGKALAANEAHGFAKVITDAAYDEIIGVHLVGPHVTEMIAGPAAYIDCELTSAEIANVVHPHPSASEAIMEAMHDVHGKAIHF